MDACPARKTGYVVKMDVIMLMVGNPIQKKAVLVGLTMLDLGTDALIVLNYLMDAKIVI